MNCRSPVVEEKLSHGLLLLTECNRISHSLSSMNMGALLLLKLIIGPIEIVSRTEQNVTAA